MFSILYEYYMQHDPCTLDPSLPLMIISDEILCKVFTKDMKAGNSKKLHQGS